MFSHEWHEWARIKYRMSQLPTLNYQPPPPPDGRTAHLIRSLPPFVAGVLLGGAIWALSVVVIGEMEAWDRPSYYFPTLLGGGFAAALLGPRHFWAAPLGLWCGQVPFVTIGLMIGLVPGGPLWIAGVATGTLLTAMVGGAGALAASGFARVLTWLFH
jgi:hypothetical protein